MKHGVTLQDVRDAVQYPAQLLRASWLDSQIDPQRAGWCKMDDMSGWQSKEDLDLSHQDLDDMLEAGEPVVQDILPVGVTVVKVMASYGGTYVPIAPPPLGLTALKVSAPIAV